MNQGNSPEEPAPQQPPDGAASPESSEGATPTHAEAPRDGTALGSSAEAAAPFHPEPVQPQGDDRRSSPRRKKLLRIQIKEVHVADDVHVDDESEPFPGWVTDRSLGGLRLEVERKIEAGTFLKVHSPYSSDKTPWVEVCVQSVQDMEDCRYLGCSFVRSPTWEVLMQFG